MEIKKGIPTFDVICKKQPEIARLENATLSCPIHGSFEGQIAYYDDGTSHAYTTCPICIQENMERERKEEEQKARERLISKCKECNVEPEYYDKYLSDYVASNESQEKALNAAKDLLSGKLKKIVLLGSNGTGKTMLGSIIAKELDGKIYSMYEISTMIRQSYTMKAERSELEIVKELAEVPFLAIDEVGRTNGSSSEKNWLSYILDKRHVRGLPFMLMTNGHLRANCPEKGCEKCFENYMDKDIVSRLYQDSKIINITGNDYRKRRDL